MVKNSEDSRARRNKQNLRFSGIPKVRLLLQDCRASGESIALVNWGERRELHSPTAPVGESMLSPPALVLVSI